MPVNFKIKKQIYYSRRLIKMRKKKEKKNQTVVQAEIYKTKAKYMKQMYLTFAMHVFI